MTTQDFFRQWLSEQKTQVKYRTWSRYEEIVRMHIEPKLGVIPLRKLNDQKIQIFIAELSEKGNLRTGEGLSDNSVAQIVGVLKRGLKTARMMGKIRRNPTETVRLKHKQKRIEAFSESEQNVLEEYIYASNNPYYYGILLALYTGVRIGELLALTWEDVDFRNKCIRVDKTLGKQQGNRRGDPYCNQPKTEAGIRNLPFPAQLVPILKRMKRQGSVYVVSNRLGSFVKINGYQRTFSLMLKRLKITHRGFHSLRHTFATRAIEAGTDVKTLSELMGHSSPAITLSRYVHSTPKQKKQVSMKLGERLKNRLLLH